MGKGPNRKKQRDHRRPRKQGGKLSKKQVQDEIADIMKLKDLIFDKNVQNQIQTSLREVEADLGQLSDEDIVDQEKVIDVIARAIDRRPEWNPNIKILFSQTVMTIIFAFVAKDRGLDMALKLVARQLVRTPRQKGVRPDELMEFIFGHIQEMAEQHRDTYTSRDQDFTDRCVSGDFSDINFVADLMGLGLTDDGKLKFPKPAFHV